MIFILLNSPFLVPSEEPPWHKTVFALKQYHKFYKLFGSTVTYILVISNIYYLPILFMY